MKRIAAMLLVFILASHLCLHAEVPSAVAQEETGAAQEPQDGTEPPEEGANGQEVTVAENERLALSVDLSTCAVTLLNKADGMMWSTNPPEPPEDEYTSGAILNDIRSQLVVTYYDSQKNTASIGSYLSCVKQQSYEIRKIKNGVRITYFFSRETEQFSIPVEFKLDEDALDVKIPVKDIQEFGEARIAEIQLLPFFFRGNMGEDGYLLIPDGSGALIRFSDIRPYASPYKEKVYGRDLATSYNYDEGDKEAARLPVFGISRGGGLLAVIDKNESAAYIEANSVGAVSSMANVCASFTYRQMDTALIAGKDWNYNEYTVVNEQPASRDMGLRILPLDNGHSSYSDMAVAYREYLLKAGKLTPLTENEQLDGAVEFFGKTTERRSFFGIPYNHAIAATTFDEAADILKDLSEAGSGRLGTFLYGFGSTGYPKNENWNSTVGGKKGYDRLLSAQANNGIIYNVQNFLYEENPSFLWLRQKKFARSLDRDYLLKNRYSLSTYGISNDGSARHGLTAAELTKRLGRFLEKQPTREGAGLALEYIGADLYSDYAENSYTERQEMLETICNLLEQGAQRPLAADGGNAYLLGSVRTLYEIPTSSSCYDCAPYSVPFYTMVLHGYVNLMAVPLNMEADEETAFLQCIEAGALPNFRVTARENIQLVDTSFSFLYNTGYAGIRDSMKEKFRVTAELYQGLLDQPIVSHSRTDDVAITTYADGTRIVVNYKYEPVQLEGTSIPARGYMRFPG